MTTNGCTLFLYREAKGSQKHFLDHSKMAFKKIFGFILPVASFPNFPSCGLKEALQESRLSGILPTLAFLPLRRVYGGCTTIHQTTWPPYCLQLKASTSHLGCFPRNEPGPCSIVSSFPQRETSHSRDNTVQQSSQEHSIWAQNVCIHISAPPLIRYRSFGKSLNYS